MDEKCNVIAANPNRALIFQTLIQNGPMSRVELSKQLKLGKMSVTNYVNDLTASGLVQETGAAASYVGRKAVLLDVTPERPLFGSVQLTRHYISAGVANCKGDFLNIATLPVDASDNSGSILSKVTLLLDQLLPPQILRDVWAIGASSRGPVSWQAGLLYTQERPDTGAIQIRDLLEERYGVPVYTNNDVYSLLFAERYFGNAVHCDTFAMVSSDIGLGCGMMIKDQMYEGINGFGALLGHITVHADGIPCYCGNRGCLERYAGVPATVEWVRREHERLGTPCPVHNWQEFLAGAAGEDAVCRRALDRLIAYLGAGLVTLVNLFNPGRIFLGECYAQAAPLLAEPLAQYIRAHQFFPQDVATEVCASRFLGSSPLIGPAAFAMHMSLNGRHRHAAEAPERRR